MTNRKKSDIGVEVISYEKSYPYNVLYDLFLQDENCDVDFPSANEQLCDYDIHLFINLMNTCLTDRERRCIECKYRYGLTLEVTAKAFNVTRERIRQILAHATRKLRCRIHKCRKISRDDYMSLKFAYDTMCRNYDKMMALLEKISGNEPIDILSVLEKYEQKQAFTDIKIDDMELTVRSYNCLVRAGFKTIQDIVDADSRSVDGKWIFRVRNLGQKSIEEIRVKLSEEYNYTLKFWRDKE